VVVKGVSADEVLVGDPSLGAKTIPRKNFEKMLANRILFVITSNRETAVFDSPADWLPGRKRRWSCPGSGLDYRSGINRPGPNYY